MASLELINLKKSFDTTDIIRSCDLKVQEGEFIVLVGPSGCGKSTLLRCISGLEEITSGSLWIDGKDCTKSDPVSRGIGMVFQSYALYPHMTVSENIGFGLRIAGESKPVIAKRVQEVAQILHLEALLDRKPKATKRVAIGRALAREPKIFLFDEPLSNLDASLRAEMRVELAKLHQELKNTMIYVTHDQVEAMTLATRMVVMQAGVVEQVGTPLELFNQPATRFVAGFLGQPPMNFIKITDSNKQPNHWSSKLCGQYQIDLPHSINPHGKEMFELGVRPEDFQLSNSAEAISFQVNVIEQLGSDTIIYGQISDDQNVTVRLAGQVSLTLGEVVKISPVTERAIAFDSLGNNLAFTAK
jgi:multiple sugar transport system ATP-binding protein